MDSAVHLAIDMMSGDCGPRVSIPASLQVLREHSHLHLHLVGQGDAIERAVEADPLARARTTVHDAGGVLPARATLSEALRQSRDTSLGATLDLLDTGEIKAAVSAAHTGVLMALSLRRAGMIAGFSRPAACSAIPSPRGPAYMLDMGANVDCSPAQLREFALMGSALVTALHGVSAPRVALLSNGSEATKGNRTIRDTAALLVEDPAVHFAGFIEGSGLLDGAAEIILCDGLLGNVALKVAEGTAGMAVSQLRRQFRGHWWRHLLGRLAAPQLARLERSLNTELHGGAFLLGLQSVVVKSHGAAGEAGFAAAILQAANCVENRMVDRLSGQLVTQEQSL